MYRCIYVGLLTAGSGDVCHLNLPHVLLHVLNVEVLHLHLPDAPAGLPIGALDNILGDEQLDLLEWVHQCSDLTVCMAVFLSWLGMGDTRENSTCGGLYQDQNQDT